MTKKITNVSTLRVNVSLCKQEDKDNYVKARSIAGPVTIVREGVKQVLKKAKRSEDEKIG